MDISKKWQSKLSAWDYKKVIIWNRSVEFSHHIKAKKILFKKNKDHLTYQKGIYIYRQ